MDKQPEQVGVKSEEPKSESELAQDFVRDYQLLCEKYQFRIVVSPTWVATNHGSFEMVLQQTVGRLPKQEVQK